MTTMTLVEAEIELRRAAEIVGVTIEQLQSWCDSGDVTVQKGNRSLISFSELCRLDATAFFARAHGVENDSEFSSPAMCGSLCVLPMLSFANEVARARYDIHGRIVGTTNPNHVPERYVILTGTEVCRTGSLFVFEEQRALRRDRRARIYVFDTMQAAELLVDAIATAPFRWIES